MGTLRIGITGHRILPKNHDLDGAIDQVIEIIGQKHPGQDWMVYSALAEGADCILVSKALQRSGVSLLVVLPLPVSEYLSTFKSSQDHELFHALYQRAIAVEMVSPQATREKAYEIAGEYILDHCDLLVAIWDGKKAQGIGGTGQIAMKARERKLPLAWIQAGNRHTGTLDPTHLGARQGTVIYERF